jgi:hypothetical protein
MSDDAVKDFLSTKDELGFVHFDLIGGGGFSFAPCDDLESGEAYLADRDTKECRYVTLDQAMANPETYPTFLMSREDFMLIVDEIASGRLSPKHLS